MQDIHINKDIRTFKPRIAGPFTLRNIIGLGVAAVIGGPLFALCRAYGVNLDISLICVVFGAVPGFCIGWFQIAGLPFEKGIMKVINTNFGRTKYLYSSKNDYLKNKENIVIQPKKTKMKFYS